MFKVRNVFAILVGLSLAFCNVSSGMAQEADGPVILRVSAPAQLDKPVSFSLKDLERLERTVVKTSTPWHDGVATFEGVRLRDVLKHTGATGSALRVTALNRYATDIPFDDVLQHDVILAYKLNGNYMSIKDRGPLFIIYPFDSNPALKNDKFFVRSVWQVASIELK